MGFKICAGQSGFDRTVGAIRGPVDVPDYLLTHEGHKLFTSVVVFRVFFYPSKDLKTFCYILLPTKGFIAVKIFFSSIKGVVAVRIFSHQRKAQSLHNFFPGWMVS